ncbi:MULTISPECIES: hypothetical protein [unclassified Micromonospora]|uniref:hypothetical protein n=1 Tax=unclassified Micromonospora TaxID=2617518 RepID=UPI003624AED1
MDTLTLVTVVHWKVIAEGRPDRQLRVSAVTSTSGVWCNIVDVEAAAVVADRSLTSALTVGYVETVRGVEGPLCRRARTRAASRTRDRLTVRARRRNVNSDKDSSFASDGLVWCGTGRWPQLHEHSAGCLSRGAVSRTPGATSIHQVNRWQ